MKDQDQHNYQRIARAIEYIREHFQGQPSLDEVAEKVHLSPYHFQRLFSDWAGTSPKKFLQYISIGHAKKLLKENRLTLSETAYKTGLSGTSRLHDLFMKIEGMSPAEFKNGGRNLIIRHSFSQTPFGRLLVGSTEKGICHMGFSEDDELALEALKNQFPNADFISGTDQLQQSALAFFSGDWSKLCQVRLHLKGTDFQMKVWEALLRIPQGGLTSYKSIAESIGNPSAVRAVGSAIGSNPVAFLIPCHRVIQSGGGLGGYKWGLTRKSAMIGWEAAAPE